METYLFRLKIVHENSCNKKPKPVYIVARDKKEAIYYTNEILEKPYRAVGAMKLATQKSA